jgi:hypothetical protein
MTAPLQYIEAVAHETSSRSLSGSQSSELARLTLEVTADLREMRSRMDSHHAYLSGLSGRNGCPICIDEEAMA